MNKEVTDHIGESTSDVLLNGSLIKLTSKYLRLYTETITLSLREASFGRSASQNRHLSCESAYYKRLVGIQS